MRTHRQRLRHKRLRRLVLIAGITLVVLAILHWWLNADYSSRPNEPAIVTNTEPLKPAAPAPGGPPSALSSPSPSSLSAETRALVLKCLNAGENTSSKRWNEAHAESLETVLREFQKRGSFSEELEQENIHLTTFQGQKRRLRIAPVARGDGSARLVAQLFTLDAETLPVLQPLPKDYQDLSADEIKTRFLSTGETTFTDSTVLLSDTAQKQSVQVHRNNGKIIDLEFYFADKFLGCAQGKTTECKCL